MDGMVGVVSDEDGMSGDGATGFGVSSGVAVNASGNASIGAVGNNNTVLIGPQALRELRWPMVVGSALLVATAFQERVGVLAAVGGASGVVLRQTLAGDGGVGKSQIAAGLFWGSDAELRVWVNGESPDSVMSAYASAAVQLQLGTDRDLAEDLSQRFVNWLATTQRSWLVVLDNVVDPADMVGLWPPPGGRVVVTTRRRDVKATGLKVVDVGCFTEAEAETYLVERLGGEDGAPVGVLGESEELAADLGFLPLALSHAAAVIDGQGITCAAYRVLFADKTKNLGDVLPLIGDTDGYARNRKGHDAGGDGVGWTVAATWVLAVEAADELEPVGLALPLAWLVAVCDADGAPESLFTCEVTCERLGRALGREIDQGHARSGLQALRRLSLITHTNDGTDARAVRMHNVTARAVMETLSPETLDGVLQAMADSLMQVWPDIERQSGWGASLRASLETFTCISPDALWDDDSGCHLVLFRAGRSLREAGLSVSAVAYFERLLREAKNRLVRGHPYLLILGNDVAMAVQDTGDAGGAVPMFERVVQDHEFALGPNHEDTLACRNNLASAVRQAGDKWRAVTLFSGVAADLERVLGPDAPHTLASRHNLANAIRDAGDAARATQLFQDLEADMVRVLGPDHVNTLLVRSNFANAVCDAGEPRRAVKLFQDLEADMVRVLGPDHVNTLIARSKRSTAVYQAGDTPRAVALFNDLLADQLRVLGSGHPDVGVTRRNLAFASQGLGAMGR